MALQEIGSSYAHEAGYDAFMTAAAFGTMLRMFVQHSEMARLLADPAATAQEEPHLSSVQHLRGRLNVGRWAGFATSVLVDNVRAVCSAQRVA